MEVKQPATSAYGRHYGSTDKGRDLQTSMKSCLASSTPATSSKVMPVLGSIWNLALDLPKASGLLPPGPPGPPCERRDSRNRPPTNSSGNARLPAAHKRSHSLFQSMQTRTSDFTCSISVTFRPPRAALQVPQ